MKNEIDELLSKDPLKDGMSLDKIGNIAERLEKALNEKDNNNGEDKE